MPEKGIIYNIQRMSMHDGPGLRTTVFFKGCPLRCLWCSNPESQSRQPQIMHFASLCVNCGACLKVCPSGAVTNVDGKIGRDFSRCTDCGACAQVCPTTAAIMSGRAYTVQEVMDVVLKDTSFYANSRGGVTFSGGECTVQEDFLMALVNACLDEGLHTCVDTCGHTDPVFFSKLLDKVDLFLFDIKHMDSAQHVKLTGVSNKLIFTNLKSALQACPEKICIRIPLIPGLNDREKNIADISRFLNEYGLRHVDILPYHTFSKNKYEALCMRKLTIQEYTNEQLNDVLHIFSQYNIDTEIVS